MKCDKTTMTRTKQILLWETMIASLAWCVYEWSSANRHHTLTVILRSASVLAFAVTAGFLADSIVALPRAQRQRTAAALFAVLFWLSGAGIMWAIWQFFHLSPELSTMPLFRITAAAEVAVCLFIGMLCLALSRHYRTAARSQFEPTSGKA
jgi:hypothetical protein